MPFRERIAHRLGWLKQAFALDAGPLQLTEDEQAMVDRVCREVIRRRMTVPALMFLESVRPLNFIGAQTLHFFAPFVSVLTDSREHEAFARLLEHRRFIDYLCKRLEALDE